MAQIIRHRKGVLESVASATKRKAELLVVTGSSASAIDTGLLFIGTEGGSATVSNKVHSGITTPDLTGANYDTSIDGIPFYNTDEEKFYILKKGGNVEIKATANTGNTGIVSSSAQIDGLGFLQVNGDEVVSSSAQITIGDTTGFSTFSSSLKATDDAQGVRLDNLETFSSSLGDGFATDAELTAVSSAFDSTIDALTTDEIAEGSNLYFTDARVKSKLDADGVISSSAQVQIDSVTGFTAFSSSADSRLDTIEASLGEGGGIGGRVENLETFSASAEANDVELFATASDQEGRLDFIEAKTLVSSSAQIVTRLNNQNVDFGSGNITATSFTGNGANLTNIPLGTATTGDYVDSLVAGTSIVITNNSGEGATPTVATVQDISDSASPTFNNLTLNGDLSVTGTTTTTNQTTLTVSDSKIFLADGNVSDSIDSAIIFNYADNGTPDTAGMFRDATDGSITFFGSYTGSAEVGNSIDITNPNFSLGVVKAAEFDGALDFSNITNKPDPTITLSMGGDVSANATVTLTDLGDATLHVTASIPADTNLTLNDLTIDGNLTITGTTTSTNTETVSSESPLILLNSGSLGNPDVGIIGKYDVDGTTTVNGFFRDATDGKWKVFDGSTQDMSDTALVNIANAGYELGTIEAGSFSGSLDFSYLQNVPDPTITINAGGDLSGSAETTLTDLADGTLNLDLTLPTTSNLTFNSLTISSDLSVVGNIDTDNLEASGDITASAGAQIGTNLTVGGDATVTGDISADNLVLAGNLTVQGTTTTVDSTTVQIGDNILELNGTGATNGGLLVNDTDGPLSGSLLWDGANNYWKAGGQGEESQILVAGGMGVVSGSTQITAANTIGFSTSVKEEMDADGVISGSSQVDLEFVVGDTDDVNEGSVNRYYTDARVKTKMNADGVISGSSQVDIDTVSGFTTYSSSVDTRINNLDSNLDGNIKTKLDAEGVISGSTQVNVDHLDTDDLSEGSTNLYFTDARVKTKLDADSVVSSSAQVIGHLVGNDVVTNGITGTSLQISGDANIDGNLTLGGNITIGDATTDTVSFVADLSSDIIPDTNNSVDLGSSAKRFAEVHATTLFGAINATNNIVSSSAATANVEMTVSNGVVSAELKGGVVSGSSQVASLLLNQATDFGNGRISGDNFGDVAGTSTFTGSFVGDGSGLTGLVSSLGIAGTTGTDTVDLLTDTLTFAGGTAIDVAVTDNTITVNASDASTSAKGIASFVGDDFSVTDGAVSIKDGGVRAANFNADVVGTGISLNGSDNSLDVDYGSTAGTAVQGNTTISVSGTANEVEITGTTSQALGGGVSYQVGLPSDVTVGNDLTVTTDLQVGGNTVITGNLSVLGTTTTVDSTTVQIGDNVLELNYGGAQDTAGLLVTDSTAPNTVSGSLVWNGTNDVWTAGPLGSEKEIARLNSAPTADTIQKVNADGLLVDSVLTDDGTDATFSGDVIVSGLAASSFLYSDANKQLTAITPSNAGDVIQWNGSSFVASNELDGGTF